MAAVLATAAVAGVSACSNSGGNGGDDRQSETAGESYTGAEVAEHTGLTAGLALPLDAYALSPKLALEYGTAQHMLIEQCMAGKGFDIELVREDPVRDFQPTASNITRRYGITRMAWAEEYGYALPPEYEDPPVGSRYVPASEAERIAFKGNLSDEERQSGEVGGCQGQALDALPFEPESLVDELDAQSLHRSESDPRVTEVVEAWSQCMGDRGYDYASPYEIGVPPHGGDDPQTAVADIQCKEQTSLVTVWFEAESEIQRDLIESNQAALEAEARTWERLTEKVAEVIAGYAGG